jgi:hypothetical protein
MDYQESRPSVSGFATPPDSHLRASHARLFADVHQQGSVLV